MSSIPDAIPKKSLPRSNVLLRIFSQDFILRFSLMMLLVSLQTSDFRPQLSDFRLQTSHIFSVSFVKIKLFI